MKYFYFSAIQDQTAIITSKAIDWLLRPMMTIQDINVIFSYSSNVHTVFTQKIHFATCIDDGVWMDWSPWSFCNVTCGGGQQFSIRDCDGPYYGGTDCQGPSIKWQMCGENPCPGLLRTKTQMIIIALLLTIMHSNISATY